MESDTPATLKHARVTRGKIGIRVVVLSILAFFVAASGAGVYWWIGRVQRILDSDPRIGPVDWSTVLGSSRLMRAAMELSTHPERADFMGSGNLGTLDPFIGANPNDVSIAIQFPLKYDQRTQKLSVDLAILNTGRSPYFVPRFRSFATIGPYGAGWLEDADPRAQAFSGIMIKFAPLLGQGGRWLKPGESLIFSVDSRAPSTPCSFGVYAFLTGGRQELLLNVRSDDSGASASWEAVDGQSLERRYFPAGSSSEVNRE